MFSLFNPRSAFTLAELLIVLGVLGIIATFTIPKTLTAYQFKLYQAMAKEAVSATAQAYQVYKMNNTISTTTKATDFLASFQGAETYTGLIDDNPDYGAINCAFVGTPCIRLHNGGVMWADANSTFIGTSPLHAVYLSFDPDGQYGGTTSGNTNGKALGIWLYYNGRVTTEGFAPAGSILYGVTLGPPNPLKDPDWFQWR